MDDDLNLPKLPGTEKEDFRIEKALDVELPVESPLVRRSHGGGGWRNDIRVERVDWSKDTYEDENWDDAILFDD